MGWTDSHLYEIRAGSLRWGLQDPDWPDGPLDARKAKLEDLLEDGRVKTLRYLYDFGDGWEHTVKIERLVDAEAGVLYPRLLAASGRCPPEDCGGPWGYGEILEARDDPKDPRHAEIKEWIGEDFDPKVVGFEALASDVAALAKKWARKPPAKRSKAS